MKISIITITYNSEKTLDDTIKSVLSQTYNDIEYIIVDGKSKDTTIDIVKSYGDKISKVVTEKDNGIYDAMNKGLRLATGDVVGILNSDDVYFDEHVIEKVMHKFQKENVDSVYGDLYYVKPENVNEVVRYWKSSEFIKGSFAKGWHPPHPSFFVKREAYEKHGFFDLNMKVSADFELMLRFLEKFQISTVYLPKVIVRMRTGGESNSSIGNIIRGNRSILKAFEKNQIKINKLLYPFYRFVPKIIQMIKKGK
ncbi:MAG: glycosyltransferase family 2 protein [Sulfuricurvum sp.]|nr:glycosyltransferase family 2 protein [Sulfuricurvum sp.]